MVCNVNVVHVGLPQHHTMGITDISIAVHNRSKSKLFYSTSYRHLNISKVPTLSRFYFASKGQKACLESGIP